MFCSSIFETLPLNYISPGTLGAWHGLNRMPATHSALKTAYSLGSGQLDYSLEFFRHTPLFLGDYHMHT